MAQIVFDFQKDPMGFNRIKVTKDNWHKDKRDIRFDIEIISENGLYSKIQLSEEEAADLVKAIDAEIFLQPENE